MTGQITGAFPKVEGTIYASAPDGSGGWFIGGYFGAVGGIVRANLAHILANGSVDAAWNPGSDYSVRSLAVSGSVLYVGGYFTTIGGQTRNRIAALNAATGAVMPWNPNADGSVMALAVSGGTIYAGGEFRTIGGQGRNKIAALDAATGNATAWNPAAGGTYDCVYALAPAGGLVYAGGDFSLIGGQARNNLAALDAATGNATAWNPDPNDIVYALAVSGSLVYAGGKFYKMAGQNRIGMAAIASTTGLALPWEPINNGAVHTLALSGSTLYIGGEFTRLGVHDRLRIAALDAATGVPTAWDPGANSTVHTLALAGTTLFAGGEFTSIVGLKRNGIAALDVETGVPTAWSPEMGGDVHCLAVTDSVVYAGGFFTIAKGYVVYQNIVALDRVTGQPTAWNPGANGFVDAMALSGSTLYAGGAFYSLGGQSRYYLGAVDTVSGAATSWNPNPDARVYSLLSSGSTLYVGGSFSSIGGQTRRSLAAFDLATGAINGWNPDATAPIFAMASTSSTLYAGGMFLTMGGQSRNHLAALDPVSGALKPWNPNANGDVYCLKVAGSTVYAGGSFTSVGGAWRPDLAALDAVTGSARSWQPNPDSSINALAMPGKALLVGGWFTTIGGMGQSYFARFEPIPCNPSNPGAMGIQTDRITWKWQDNSDNENGFKAWVDAGSADPVTLRTTTDANATSWTQTGLAANAQYAFQVAATNEDGDSYRTPKITAWTAIEPVTSINFTSVTTTRFAFAAGNPISNLSAGSSGITYRLLPTSPYVFSGIRHTNPVLYPSNSLNPNTRYTVLAKSRNGAGVETPETSASVHTLAGPAVVGTNLACDRETWRHQPAGTVFTFSNPKGFGTSVHSGSLSSPYMVSAYNYAWDTAKTHAFSGSEAQWSSGTLALACAAPGQYFLHVQSVNGDGVASATVDYGPFYYDLPSPSLMSSLPTTSTWVTDRAVRAIATTTDTVYIGGSFHYVGPVTGSGVPFSLASGQPSVYPKVNGTVRASIADGAGGWFIGGEFTSVGGLPRSRLAHILADGSIDQAWNPGAGGTVRALAREGSTLYVGGSFTTLGGLPRQRIGAIDAASGAVAAWNPNANNTVYALAVSGGVVYAGGSFGIIGGQLRRCIAALDTVTTAATAWNPDASGITGSPAINSTAVYALAISDGLVYAGGMFTTIGGQPRSCLAALDTVTTAATSWNPSVNGAVNSVAVAGGTVYAGGTFNTIGGQNRKSLAAIEAATGAVTAWNPILFADKIYEELGYGAPYGALALDQVVHALQVVDGVVYAGGYFNNIGGGWRSNVAALDPATGNALAWSPGANDFVYTLAPSGGKMYLGGKFVSAGGVTRNCLAALDTATGAATDWNPIVTHSLTAETQYTPYGRYPFVSALAVKDGTVYTGGYFTHVGGRVRTNIAAVNATSGVPMSWNPEANWTVDALALSSSTLYAGGEFTTIGGLPRNSLAALDLVTTGATAWNPNANNAVLALAVANGVVYAGGAFGTIGGQPRNGLAALDSATGLATVWNPNASGTVNALKLAGSTIYAGGAFTSIGGQPRGHLAALDATTGLALNWKPSVSGTVNGLVLLDSAIYTCGSFTSYQDAGPPISRSNLAAVDAFSGGALPWNPNANGLVNAMTMQGSTLYVGGEFTAIGGQPQPYFARFDMVPAAPSDPGASSLQADRITWAWRDHSTDEDGFKVWADAGTGAPVILRTTTAADATNWTMGGLTPNTLYTFQAAAIRGTGSSAKTDAYSTITLAAAPSLGNNFTCDMPVSTWLPGGMTLTFSNPAGFGAGTDGGNPWRVSGYHWTWDASPVHVFGGSEPLWAEGALAQTPALSGKYYLHLSSVNAAGAANVESGDFGPYQIDAEAPGAPTAPDRPAAVATDPLIIFTWAAPADAGGSGVASYECQIGTAPGAADVFSGDVGNTLGKSITGAFGTTCYCRVRAVDGAGNIGAWSASSLGVLLAQAPVIVDQTYGQMVNPGVTVAFSVTAGGTAPLAYQWRKDGVNLAGGGRISGTTASTLQISGVMMADTGRYDCVITNIAGSAASLSAPLVVNPTLTVASPFGVPSPPAGAHIYTTGSLVSVSMGGSPVVDTTGTTRQVCTGWSGSGSAPASGSGLFVDFVMNRDSSLTWRWKTQYQLAATANPAAGGQVTLEGSGIPAAGTWHDSGTTVTLRAAANAGYTFAGWSGAAAGSNTTTSLGMTQPRALTAIFARILQPGALTAVPAALRFLEGSGYEVDVEHGHAPQLRSIALTNTGEQTLSFTGPGAVAPGLAISGRRAADFQIVSVTPSTALPLAPGAGVTVTIRFAPTATVRTLGLDAMLTVTTNSLVTPALIVPLLGDAVPVELSGFAVE